MCYSCSEHSLTLHCPHCGAVSDAEQYETTAHNEFNCPVCKHHSCNREVCEKRDRSSFLNNFKCVTGSDSLAVVAGFEGELLAIKALKNITGIYDRDDVEDLLNLTNRFHAYHPDNMRIKEVHQANWKIAEEIFG